MVPIFTGHWKEAKRYVKNYLMCSSVNCWAACSFGGMTLNTAAETCGSQLCHALNSSAAMVPFKGFPHSFCFARLADSCRVSFLQFFCAKHFPPAGAGALWLGEFLFFHPLHAISFAAPILANLNFAPPCPALSSLPWEVIHVSANSMSKAYLQAVCVQCRWSKVCQEKQQLILEQLRYFFLYIYIYKYKIKICTFKA